MLGIPLGLAAGVVDILLMLPMKFADQPTALAAAFCSRFAIGFIAANVTLAVAGALVGLLISIPDAIITKSYVPIIITGLIFGALAGWAARAWAA